MPGVIPWVLAACVEERASTARQEGPPPASSLAPRAWRVAVAFALQALCGEPVTWVATGVLALALGLRRAAVPLGLAAGALLASAQLLPTFLAGLAAHRGALATPDFW